MKLFSLSIHKAAILSYLGSKSSNCPFAALQNWWVSSCGVVAKALEFKIFLSEFELQFSFYVHFRSNTLGKGMDRNSTINVLLQQWL